MFLKDKVCKKFAFSKQVHLLSEKFAKHLSFKNMNTFLDQRSSQKACLLKLSASFYGKKFAKTLYKNMFMEFAFQTKVYQKVQ